MKKLIFTLSAVAAASILGLQAQNAPKAVRTQPFNNKSFDEKYSPWIRHSGFGKTESDPAWYNYPLILNQASILTDGTRSRLYLGHDSLAKYVFNDDTVRYNYALMAAGAILDPTDDVIANSDDPSLQLTKFTTYRVDSIGFTYSYVRPVESKDDGNGGTIPVVDTLFIFSFNNNGIYQNSFTGGSNAGRKFAYTRWDQNKRYPLGYAGIDTVFLTSAEAPDTNVSFYGYMSVGLRNPITVPKANGTTIKYNLTGFVAVFKSGIVYDSSFTALYYGNSTPPPADKRVNYFGASVIFDNATSPVIGNTFYNTSMLAPNFLAYPPTSQISLIPNFAYYTKPSYFDAEFRITALNTGIDETQNGQFAMSNVYPNPAQANGTAVMAFNLKNSANVNVAIYNIAGVQVKTVINKNFAAGEHNEEMSLAGLKAGIYFVNMNVNGSTITKKLTITE